VRERRRRHRFARRVLRPDTHRPHHEPRPWLIRPSSFRHQDARRELIGRSGEDGWVEPDVESDAEVIEASLREPARFGVLFDRHPTVVHRYLVRRLGPGEAEALVGDVFRIAFERRAAYDLERPTARPWLYGIATNLVAKQRRSEARRF